MHLCPSSSAVELRSCKSEAGGSNPSWGFMRDEENERVTIDGRTYRKVRVQPEPPLPAPWWVKILAFLCFPAP